MRKTKRTPKKVKNEMSGYATTKKARKQPQQIGK